MRLSGAVADGSSRSCSDTPWPAMAGFGRAREQRWASTMPGHAGIGGIATCPRRFVGGQRVGHAASTAAAREDLEAAHAGDAGHARPRRRRPGRSRRSPTHGGRASNATGTASCTPVAFRRLAGKTQVFVFPDDHQRTRLTHALGGRPGGRRRVARALGLNVALDRGDRPRPRLRPRPGWPRQRGRPVAVRRRRLRPCGVGRRRHARR